MKIRRTLVLAAAALLATSVAVSAQHRDGHRHKRPPHHSHHHGNNNNLLPWIAGAAVLGVLGASTYHYYRGRPVESFYQRDEYGVLYYCAPRYRGTDMDGLRIYDTVCARHHPLSTR